MVHRELKSYFYSLLLHLYYICFVTLIDFELWRVFRGNDSRIMDYPYIKKANYIQFT
jgi:hypothetical protein